MQALLIPDQRFAVLRCLHGVELRTIDAGLAGLARRDHSCHLMQDGWLRA